jgi:eukaryotic-like serine/threonine-protein kinase
LLVRLSQGKTTPLEQVQPNVPAPLAAVVRRALAHSPSDRYPDAATMSKDLESFLGLEQAGAFSPPQAEVQSILLAAKQFSGAPKAGLRTTAPFAMIAAAFALLLILLPFSWRAAAFPLMAMLSGIAVATGLISIGGSHRLATLVRGECLRGNVLTWITRGTMALLLIVALALIGMLPYALVGAVIGVGAGMGYFFGIWRPVQVARRTAIGQVEEVMRQWRLAGVDEETIRATVARESGSDWEELFESLFGYRAMFAFRARVGSGRRKHWAWRDRWIQRLESRAERIAKLRDQERLEAVEVKGLVASGVPEAQAKAQAAAIASQWIEETRMARLPNAVDPAAARKAKQARMKQLLQDAREGKRRAPVTRLATGPIAWALGNGPRAILAASLLLVFANWARHNSDAVRDSIAQTQQQLQQATDAAQQAIAKGTSASGAPSGSDEAPNPSAEGAVAAPASNTSSNNTAMIRVPVLGNLSVWSVGIAGVLLLLSLMGSGWRMSLFAYPAAAIAMLLPIVMPSAVVGVPAWIIAGVAGLAIWLLSAWFGSE